MPAAGAQASATGATVRRGWGCPVPGVAGCRQFQSVPAGSRRFCLVLAGSSWFQPVPASSGLLWQPQRAVPPHACVGTVCPQWKMSIVIASKKTRLEWQRFLCMSGCLCFHHVPEKLQMKKNCHLAVAGWCKVKLPDTLWEPWCRAPMNSLL